MKILLFLLITINAYAQISIEDKELLNTKLTSLIELEKKYETTKLQWMSQLNARSEKYKNLVKETNRALKKNEELTVFLKVNSYWKELAQSPFNLKDNTKNDLIINPPKPIDEDFIKRVSGSKSTGNYLNLHDKLTIKYNTLTQTFENYKKEQVKSHFNRLVKVAKLRATILSQISVTNIPNYSYKDFGVDLITEIKVVPYRLFGIFFNRYMFIKDKISAGFEGYVQLLKELTWFLFLIGFIFIFKYVIIFIEKKLDELREYLIKEEATSLYKLAALFLQKLDPYLKPLLWWILFDYSQVSLAKTNLEEVNYIIPYVKFYFVYVMLRIFVAALLTGIVTRKKSFFTQDLKNKISRYSKIISFIFLLTESLLFAVRSTTSQGIIYSFVINLRTYIYAITFLMISMRWDDDIKRALSALTSPGFVARTTERLKLKIFYAPIQLLIYFYIIVKNKLLMGMNFFNFSHDLSTILAEKKIQNSEELSEDEIEVNKSYKKLYDLDALESENIFVKREDHNIERISKNIAEWLEDPNEEHSIAIYGEQGTGKTTLLKKMTSEFEQADHLVMKLDEKITVIDDLYALLAKMFGHDSKDFGLNSIIKLDKELNKTIVVIDEAHNLFLSKVGGMSAYKEFMKVINLNTQNIYWVACFNKYSWRYVDAVFEKPHFFRNVYKINEWSMSEIKDLIISRHEKSRFDIEYSNLISAIKGEDELDSFTYVESKYFKILTNLSDGNPRLAMNLWLSSLKFNYSKKIITVGLPKVNRTVELSKYNDNTHFVLAELVKHQNLSVRETCDAVNLSMGEVTQTYKVALENHLIIKSKTGRYYLTPNGQYIVINFLKQRNFIYGH